MADRENVIKGLEQFKADFKPFCGNGSDWARVDNAIEMLKGDEQTIESLQHTINELTVAIDEQWHPFDPMEPDQTGLKDHFYYLVTVKGKRTPMKAKCHTDLPWMFRPVDGDFEPFDVIGWRELPEPPKEGKQDERVPAEM